MNKKGIIILIVIIILVVVGYKVFGGTGSGTASNSPVDTSSVVIPAGVTKDTYAPVTAATADTSLVTRLKSVSIAAAETGARIALVNGKAQFSVEGVKGSAVLGDIAIAKTIGGVNYAVTTFGVTSGNSTYQYAVLFQDANGTLSDKSYALVGLGATITGLRADDVTGAVVVSVSFKDVSGKAHTKILVIENGEFNSAKEINL
jgi:hypothetical protein